MFPSDIYYIILGLNVLFVLCTEFRYALLALGNLPRVDDRAADESEEAELATWQDAMLPGFPPLSHVLSSPLRAFAMS
jgi:hypothetical protein